MPSTSRLVRPLLAAAALAASVGAPQAHAVQTLAYTFAVPCMSSGGTWTAPGITMPPGRYVVTVAGACAVNMADTFGTTVPGTPCTAPAVGSIPCTAPVPVNNLPAPLCRATVAATATVEGCYTAARLVTCTVHYISVDGSCVNGAAEVINRTGGERPMNVRFVDSNYADNAGAFVVTVAWTPLP